MDFEKEEFTSVKLLQFMDSHLAPCCLKERGCTWSGTLDQLNHHLEDDCQYVDTKCPLNCLQTIPKNKVDQHVAQEYTKRPRVCRQSNFKAAFSMFEKNSVRGGSKLSRNPNNMAVKDDEDKVCSKSENTEHKFGNHKSGRSASLMSSCDPGAQEIAVNLSERLRKLELKLHEYEVKFQEMEKQKLQQQELNQMILKILEEQEQDIIVCDEKLKAAQEEKEEMVVQLRAQSKQLERLQQFTSVRKTFLVKNVSSSVKRSGWKSRSTYLKFGGCKFSITIDYTSPSDIRFSLMLNNGVFDNEIKWPCYMNFTMVLTNQKGGGDLNKLFVSNVEHGLFYKVMSLSQCEVEEYLRNDVLHFTIIK